MRECIICGQKFREGYNPKFDKKYGICKKCVEHEGIDLMNTEELKEVFMDYV